MSSGEAWLIAVVGGATATVLGAGLLHLISKTRSRQFWRMIFRALRWPLSLRLTTTARRAQQAAELSHANERIAGFNRFYADIVDALGVVLLSSDQQLLKRIGELRDAKNRADQHAAQQIAQAQAHAQQQIEATQSFAIHEAARVKREHQRALEEATQAGRSQGRADAFAEIQQQRARPRPRPQWRVDEEAGGDALVLRNTQPDVVISDVSLQAPLGDFAFAGPSQWPGPSTGVVEFHGTRQGNGHAFGVKFIVRWCDADGDPHVGEAFIDKTPRNAYVL